MGLIERMDREGLGSDKGVRQAAGQCDGWSSCWLLGSCRRGCEEIEQKDWMEEGV